MAPVCTLSDPDDSGSQAQTPALFLSFHTQCFPWLHCSPCLWVENCKWPLSEPVVLSGLGHFCLPGFKCRLCHMPSSVHPGHPPAGVYGRQRPHLRRDQQAGCAGQQLHRAASLPSGPTILPLFYLFRVTSGTYQRCTLYTLIGKIEREFE